MSVRDTDRGEGKGLAAVQTHEDTLQYAKEGTVCKGHPFPSGLCSTNTLPKGSAELSTKAFSTQLPYSTEKDTLRFSLHDDQLDLSQVKGSSSN